MICWNFDLKGRRFYCKFRVSFVICDRVRFCCRTSSGVVRARGFRTVRYLFYFRSRLVFALFRSMCVRGCGDVIKSKVFVCI